MSGGATAPFTVEPKRGVKLRGKARRDGLLWTLTLDAHPDVPAETGHDLVKARAALEARVARRMKGSP